MATLLTNLIYSNLPVRKDEFIDERSNPNVKGAGQIPDIFNCKKISPN